MSGLARWLVQKPTATSPPPGMELVSERRDFDQYIGELEAMFQRVIQEKVDARELAHG